MSAPPDQSDFGCSATSLDDITVFLGTIPPAEYEMRRRIRASRNAASFAATQTECASALTLYWMVCDTATQWIYAPADLDRLADVAKFCTRLMITAGHAERLDSFGALQ